jgi:hypothetical protein
MQVATETLLYIFQTTFKWLLFLRIFLRSYKKNYQNSTITVENKETTPYVP